ncbi:MAG: DUF917 domain-containing protein [Pseudoxanthomonas sp.]
MRIERDTLSDLASGAAFLGSGGGGDPYYGRLIAEAELARHGDVELIALETLADDALVVPLGWIGAPTVSVEKLPGGQETVAGIRKLEALLGRRVEAVLPIEIGGSNGLAPLAAAARLGLPVVDADGMGRAFPESQMAIFNIRGLQACPAVMTDANGTTVTIEHCDNLAHERIARAVSVSMGGIAHMAEYPLSGRDAKAHAIGGSVSAAIAIGAAVRRARNTGEDPFEALYAALRATQLYPYAGELFDGKIVDVERETRGGFSLGRISLEGFTGQGTMTLEFQNENLIAYRNGIACAMVPDLVTVMDRETAESITTERLKYGQRVRIVGAASPQVLREQRAMDVVGPDAFGLGQPYRPIELLNGWTSP